MKHFEILQWADFARGVAAEDERATMQMHLESGCAECRDALAFCDAFARISQKMTAHPAPEAAARLAKAICPARPKRVPRRAFRIPVELVFDSFLAPCPAGLRSSWQVGWQALYRAGDCSLDVRIEPDLRSSRAALIGQISNHVSPDTRMGDVPVCLKSGSRVVAETTSNQFGEFQLEYDQQRRLQLCIRLDGGSKRIVTPLRRIAVEDAGRLTVTGGRKRPRKGLGD
jgi:hypothetical protein